MSYILVVDDEKDIRELIGEILVDDGHDVRLAENSEQAIKFINETPPQLLILDIWLKDSKMDGIEILKSVKQNNPTVPVVIISGHGNIKIAVAAVKQGAYDFIEKPFRIQNLNKKISTTLAKISNSNEVTYKIGPFTFFPLKKVIILNDKIRTDLTDKEVDILKCLISSGEEAVDRDKLLKQVWNYSSDVTTHTLETHIYRLRQKLETDPSIPRLIISKGGSFTIRSI